MSEKTKDEAAIGSLSRATEENDVERVFKELWIDLKQAGHRVALNELYRRAGYFISTTYSPGWDKRHGGQAAALRDDAKAQFRTFVRALNARADALHVPGNFAEAWGKMKSEG